MSLTTKLERLSSGFSQLGGYVYHHHRPDLEFPCIVWAEESGNEFGADGDVAEQGLHGTLDYFTPNDIDPMIDRIQNQFRAMALGWRLESVQYEEDTGLVHWEWSWEV